MAYILGTGVKLFQNSTKIVLRNVSSGQIKIQSAPSCFWSLNLLSPAPGAPLNNSALQNSRPYNKFKGHILRNISTTPKILLSVPSSVNHEKDKNEENLDFKENSNKVKALASIYGVSGLIPFAFPPIYMVYSGTYFVFFGQIQLIYRKTSI